MQRKTCAPGFRLIVAQSSRIEAAHLRAREILKFSSLVTDAYFHYTPSQIMLAALSLADQEFAEKIIDDTFSAHGHKTADGVATQDQITSSDIKDKLLAAVEGCKEILSTELPERMQEFWSTVRISRNSPAPALPVRFTDCPPSRSARSLSGPLSRSLRDAEILIGQIS